MRRFLSAALLTLAVVGPALAGPMWDNSAPMTRKLSRYFHADPVVVITVGQDIHDPLDVLVTFELARLSGTSAIQIHKMRLGGSHWTDIMAQRGIQPQALEAGLSPLPHSLDRLAHSKGLYDQDVRELVGLRVAAGISGQPVAAVSAQHDSGVSYPNIILSTP